MLCVCVYARRALIRPAGLRKLFRSGRTDVRSSSPLPLAFTLTLNFRSICSFFCNLSVSQYRKVEENIIKMEISYVQKSLFLRTSLAQTDARDFLSPPSLHYTILATLYAYFSTTCIHHHQLNPTRRLRTPPRTFMAVPALFDKRDAHVPDFHHGRPRCER